LLRTIPGRTASRNPIELVQEFEQIVRKERDGENWPQLTAVVKLLRSELTRIAAENGLSGLWGSQSWLPPAFSRRWAA
jgi:hypothetical protein